MYILSLQNKAQTESINLNEIKYLYNIIGIDISWIKNIKNINCILKYSNKWLLKKKY